MRATALTDLSPRDEAVEISRQRRGLDFPVPGNGAVVKNLPGFTALDCANARASLGNHDSSAC